MRSRDARAAATATAIAIAVAFVIVIDVEVEVEVEVALHTFRIRSATDFIMFSSSSSCSSFFVPLRRLVPPYPESLSPHVLVIPFVIAVVNRVGDPDRLEAILHPALCLLTPPLIPSSPSPTW